MEGHTFACIGRSTNMTVTLEQVGQILIKVYVCVSQISMNSCRCRMPGQRASSPRSAGPHCLVEETDRGSKVGQGEQRNKLP